MLPKDPYGPGNTGPDGDYIVGKGRPPESGKFRKGDGRRRGRRPKGTPNLATDFREQLDGLVPVTLAGVTKKVTRQQALVMRLTDNAMKGQNTAILAVLDLEQRLVAPLRRREEERKQAEAKADLSRLSRDELRMLLFLRRKMDGEPVGSAPFCGVVPVDDESGRQTDDVPESTGSLSGQGHRRGSGPAAPEEPSPRS